MEHHGPETRTAHAAVRDPHHILHPLLQQFLRYAHIAYFGHAGIPYGSHILQYQDAVPGHRQSRVIDARMVVLDMLKNQGLAFVLHESGRSRRWLQYCTVRAEVAPEHHQR